MNVYLLILILLIGFVVGSFLNVVVLRLNTISFVSGRSKCLNCNKNLKPKDLIPILSYIMLLGKCRNCNIRISPQYPLVELFTGVVFVLTFWNVTNSMTEINFWSVILFLIYAFNICLLVIMAVYDIKHYILPWNVMRVFLLSAFVSSLVIGIFGLGINFEMFVAGFVTALPFFLIWYFSKGRLIGFGDIELMCGFGFLLGISGGFASIFVGFWLGTIYVFLKVVLTGKMLKAKDKIAFGPFLVLGFILSLLFNITIQSFASGGF